ncbi:ferritin-like domain-containing protein [Cristinia sonorae]|uniref:Ferritin-like domain-containing protein n=1 Tax=Cristinia sonorae TaxID=1940300 RepID=A0A8K0XQS8_9AGAR|nr:ferritin-like domain-containing protein [Cristinia sonorae]
MWPSSLVGFYYPPLPPTGMFSKSYKRILCCYGDELPSTRPTTFSSRDLSFTMLFSTILSAVSGASLVFAAPSIQKRQSNETAAPANSINDTQVLQFALTLELLEDAFYSEGLQRFDAAAFRDAGYPDWVRGRFEQIREHENTHVEFLRGALGSEAVQPCEYNFTFTSPEEFAATSLNLEVVGQAAYTGAAAFISDKNTLEVAANILSVEASQSAWVASAVLKGSAWSGPFETALGFNGVWSLASQFIGRCPESNPQLPVKNLPTLAFEPAVPAAGTNVTLDFTRPAEYNNTQLYVAYLNGIIPRFTAVEESEGKFTAYVPGDLQGIAFAAVVANNTRAATTDENLITGLVVLDFPVPANVNNNGTTVFPCSCNTI